MIFPQSDHYYFVDDSWAHYRHLATFTTHISSSSAIHNSLRICFWQEIRVRSNLNVVDTKLIWYFVSTGTAESVHNARRRYGVECSTSSLNISSRNSTTNQKEARALGRRPRPPMEQGVAFRVCWDKSTFRPRSTSLYILPSLSLLHWEAGVAWLFCFRMCHSFLL